MGDDEHGGQQQHATTRRTRNRREEILASRPNKLPVSCTPRSSMRSTRTVSGVGRSGSHVVNSASSLQILNLATCVKAESRKQPDSVGPQSSKMKYLVPPVVRTAAAIVIQRRRHHHHHRQNVCIRSQASNRDLDTARREIGSFLSQAQRKHMDRLSAPKPKDPENLTIIVRWRPDLTGSESFQPVSTQNHHRRQKPSSSRQAVTQSSTPLPSTPV